MSALPACLQIDPFDKVFLANPRTHNPAIRLVGPFGWRLNKTPHVIESLPVEVEPAGSLIQ